MEKERKNEFDFKFLNLIMYIGAFVIAYYVLKNVGIFDKIVEALLALTPVYLGIILCWISLPLANKLKKLGLNKNVAAIISLVIIFGFMIFVFSMIIPMLIEQLTSLAKELPNIYSSIVTFANQFLLDKFGIENGIQLSESLKSADIIQKYMGDVLSYSITTIQSVVNVVITIGTTIVVSFFMVKDIDRFKATTIDLLSKNSKDKNRRKMLIEIDSTLNSYVKGVILDSIIVGIMTTIVCMVLKLDYAIIFGIIIMFLNLIPYIGALLSYTLASLYALSVGGPVLALITFVSLFLVQVIDANILQPNIVAKSVKLHPVVVLGGLIVFELFFGILGMIIAVPVLGIGKVILKYQFSIDMDGELEEEIEEKGRKGLLKKFFNKRVQKVSVAKNAIDVSAEQKEDTKEDHEDK